MDDDVGKQDAILEVTPATGSAIRISPIPIERFDEYLLVAKIGKGGMADVFLGLCEGPGGFRKLVAIKRLHAHLQDDPDAVAMFAKEANIAARLQHPNVVQTHKAGCVTGRNFLAMEYLDGQPLSRVLRRFQADDARLPPVLSARLVADALDGLHYAHEAQDYTGVELSLIHRDISPHNLFITLGGHVKLIDFGIAKLGGLPSQTRVGLIKGKLAYMAPEQALGEPLDRRADIWSMGITLRECLTGQRLFSGGSDLDVLRATISEEIAPLHEVAPWVPDALARIVDRSLQRDRNLRFATALEFKEALDAWLLTQTAASSRSVLAATMRALFSDVIKQRRDTLRTCLGRVEASQRAATPDAIVPTHTYGTARPSRPAAIAREPKATFPWKVVAVLGTAVLAAALALLGSAPARPSIAKASNEKRAVTGASKVTKTQPAPAPPLEVSRPLTTVPTSIAKGPSKVDIHEATAPKLETPLPSRARGAPWRRPNKTAQASETEPELPTSPPAAEPTATHTPKPRERGRLILDSIPYAIVSLGDERLGITPIDVELSATTHTLTLRNPELGIETTYRVTIPPRGNVKQRVALD